MCNTAYYSQRTRSLFKTQCMRAWKTCTSCVLDPTQQSCTQIHLIHSYTNWNKLFCIHIFKLSIAWYVKKTCHCRLERLYFAHFVQLYIRKEDAACMLHSRNMIEKACIRIFTTFSDDFHACLNGQTVFDMYIHIYFGVCSNPINANDYFVHAKKCPVPFDSSCALSST